jgi:carboxypeptidase Taq
LLTAIGFDFDHGRLDVSAHPFTGGSYGDVRITTRFDEDDFLPALLATVHEGGHALYEQGRPKRWNAQPVGKARGTSMHESQALIIERQAARSDAFLAYLAPVVGNAFGGTGPAWAAENLRRVALKVEPGFIRVDADEVTYPAHVLLRYELEKAMISGDLSVEELPGAFRDEVKTFLGLDIPDDRRGCLQDIHWYAGAFGYFPTYLVGAMTAAQLFDAAKASRPDLEPTLEQGDFRPLVEWLREHIHSRASSADWGELVAAATGKEADSDSFLRHLRRRYLDAA